MAKRRQRFTVVRYRSHYTKFLDGQIWSLGPEDSESGKATPLAIRMGVLAAAKSHGVRVKTKIVKDRLEIQAYRGEEPLVRKVRFTPPARPGASDEDAENDRA